MVGPAFSGDGPRSYPVITEDVEILGDIAVAGRLEFSGRLKGNLCAGGELVVGQGAVIAGTVEAEAADIAGKIQGDVIVAGRVRLRPEAMVYGSVMGAAIVVDEGAIIESTIMTDRPDRAAPDFSNIFNRLAKVDGESVRGSDDASGV